MNALDNRAARNHVNRMCLAADIPLIESGTAGYDGQVELIKKGVSQCYECLPKPPQKTFPGCTIRNTPSEPIHCIVWSKHLFNQLFGEEDPDQDVSPDTADPEAAGDKAGEEALTAQANDKGNIERVSTRLWAQNNGYDPEKLFTKLFHDDIKYLLSMDNLWKERRPPTPLDWKNLPDEVAGCSKDNTDQLGLKDQQRWSIAKCSSIFSSALANLKKNLEVLRNKSPTDHLVWDKDDSNAMDFVAACANIRAHIFGITQKSRFDIKSMAGNIIPAIATTNAIIAGVVILHAFRILRDDLQACKSVYLRLRPNHRKQLLVPERDVNAPNPKCYVCAPTPTAVLAVDTAKMTVAELNDVVLKERLNMIAPDVIIDGLGRILISSEEGETEANNDKILTDLGVKNGSILKVDDFQQNYSLTVNIVHRDKPEVRGESPEFIIVADETDLKPKEEIKNDDEKPSTSNGVAEIDDDDLIEVDVDESPEVVEVVAKKRKTGSPTREIPSPKKRKTETSKIIDVDDDVCIMETNEEVTCLSVSSSKKFPQKRLRMVSDDDCQVIFDEGKDIDFAPQKKINQTAN